MKLNSLKIFIKVIDIGSYSLAANELEITQPAVSMQIKSLEDFFSCELITKEAGNLHLTPAGKILYRSAKTILTEWDETKLQIKQLTKETWGEIKVGASTIPAVYFLPEKLAQFRQSFPEIKVKSYHGDSQNMIEKLEADEVDVIIIGKLMEDNNYQSIPVVEDDLKLIIPANHKFSTGKSVSLTDFFAEDIILREKGSGTRKVMLDALARKGYSLSDLKISCYLGSTEAVIAGVEAGLGVSLVSKLAAKKASECQRIKIKSLSELNLNRMLYLVYKKGREQEEKLASFINQLC